MTTHYQDLRAAIAGMAVVDTHEHLPTCEAEMPSPADFLSTYLTHYISSDLLSAGLAPEDLAHARDTALPLSTRWALVAPYWERCRLTGYGRALDIAAENLYGIHGIYGDTVEALQRAYAASCGQDHLKRVLQDRCHIACALLDSDWSTPLDTRLFFRVWRPTDYIQPEWGGEWTLPWARKALSACPTLPDWVDACHRAMKDKVAQGAVALKLALAYNRSLYFPEVSDHEAAAAYASVQAHLGAEGSVAFPEVLENYMMYRLLDRVRTLGVPLQIHTGHQESVGGQFNTLANSHPGGLNNLLLTYPDIRFDLFHIGWPYSRVAIALVKMFPNATLDFCWAHILSPAAAQDTLREALLTVPTHKIFAFGGDYCFADGVAGHLILARDHLARVLADLVDEGVLTARKAIDVAGQLLYDNAREFYRLPLPGKDVRL